MSTSASAPEDILRNADTAMYHAKTMGKSRYAIFTEGLRERSLAKLEIETSLRRAVVSFDHPQDAPLEHALAIDFRAADGDPTAHVTVELDAASARRLAAAIIATLASPEAATLL